MAGYMRAQSEAAPNPAPDPATPEGAFQAPLPALGRPSLRAARALVAAGPGVGGFVGKVIADGAADTGGAD